MTSSGIVEIHGREYKTVALRVSEFRAEFSIKDGWAIVTEIIKDDDGIVIIGARILTPEGRVVARGFAEERRGSTTINKTSALENCETSAIGRALAAAGFGGSEYASANEVENAIFQQKHEKRESDYIRTKDDVAEESTPKSLVRDVARGSDWLDIPGGWVEDARNDFKILFGKCVELWGRDGFEERITRLLKHGYKADRLDEVPFDTTAKLLYLDVKKMYEIAKEDSDG